MTISAFDRTMLDAAGYTPGEIETLAMATMPDGSPQPPIDLTNYFWVEALNDHREAMENFERVAAREGVEVKREDWNSFITRWYEDVVKEADPWVFLDAIYRRIELGFVTKARWEDAYKKVQELRDRIR